MNKVSIIAPLGTSPPVITEFLQYVEEVLDQRVTDLTIITTKEPLVLEGLEAIKAAVADRYPHVHVHVEELPFKDIDSEEKNLHFINITAKLLDAQKRRYGVKAIHLCVAGGRKEVCITLSLLAQFYDVSGVYHIVMPDVVAFNQALELVRREIRELSEAEDKLAYYRKKKEKLEPVFYPSLSQYNVIRIPIIPYPENFLAMIRSIFRRHKAALKDTDYRIISRLKDLGYVKVTKNFAYITSDGEKLLKILNAIGR